MTQLEADYVIVGGGLTGCALASRLSQHDPSLSIMLLEAGPDPSPEHDIVTTMGGFALQGSALDWQYTTAPTPGTAGRRFVLTGGKTLGGGSVLNYGGWNRGDKADYDAWVHYANDDSSWSYSGMLPYFRRSESFFDGSDASEQHGYDGPIRVTSVAASDSNRKYPLRGPVREGWTELGAKLIKPSGSGENFGIAEWLENWNDGKRQPAQLAYPLSRVSYYANTPVAKVMFDTNGSQPLATDVLLQDGRVVRARKEIIISTGAIRTPALLQTSGIGPALLLAEYKIPLIHELDAVGNYFDHFALFQLFKLKPHPTGLALGANDLTDPAFFNGLPTDWVVNEGPPRAILEAALDEDGITDPTERAALLAPGRCFIETTILYHPLAPGVPVDGTFISTSVMLTLPSSRGRISLPSANLADAATATPVIEPNFFSTALDRVCLVHGARRLLQLMFSTTAMQPYIEAEVPPPGAGEPLTLASTDAEIEARIRNVGAPHFHAMGSVPLGKALDSSLRVRGVRGLRVCDASVLPSPVGGHPQATLYALAEKAAEMIAKEGVEV